MARLLLFHVDIARESGNSQTTTSNPVRSSESRNIQRPSKWKPRTPRRFPSFSSDFLPPSRPFSSLYLSLLLYTLAYYTLHCASLRARTIPRFRCASSVLVPLELRPHLSISPSTIPLTLPGSFIPFQLPRWTVSTDVFWTALLPFSLFPILSLSLSSFYLLRSIHLSAPVLPSMLLGGWPTGCSLDYLLDCKSSDLFASSSSPQLPCPLCSSILEPPSLLYPHLNFSPSLFLSRFDSLLLPS